MSASGDRWFFDRIAGVYDHFMWGADPAPLEAGLAHADRPVERVLDVAGGTGRASAALSAPERVVVDASRPMLQRARGRGLAAVQGDAAGLPVPDDAVDAVVVVDAVHHLPDVDGAFREAARVLRPGGVLLVREFDPGTLVGRGIELAERLARMDSEFYRPANLAGRIEAAGLSSAVPAEGWTYTAVGVAPE